MAELSPILPAEKTLSGLESRAFRGLLLVNDLLYGTSRQTFPIPSIARGTRNETWRGKLGSERLIRVDLHGSHEVPRGTCQAILKAAGIRTK